MESFSKIEGYEAAPETVLSLWTGLSNAVQDDALTRHAVWNVLLEAPASSRAGNAEEQALVSGAREYLEEYIAATRSLRDRLDSEWQQLAEQEPEQEPDADNVVPLPVREAWEAHVRHQASA
jgi:CHASE3 domain sensor protein